jgi:hypothetical protein
MTLRTVLAAALVLVCATPASAQDKQRQIDELRARLTKADDMLLEMARKFDLEKKRLQDEREALLDEVGRLLRENALLKAKVATLEGKQEKGKKDPVLDEKTLTLNFVETPLEEVVGFLRDITQLNVTLSSLVPDGAAVTLQVKNMTLRDALDRLCETSRTKRGDSLPLKWRFKAGTIQITTKKKKKKKK